MKNRKSRNKDGALFDETMKRIARVSKKEVERNIERNEARKKKNSSLKQNGGK